MELTLEVKRLELAQLTKRLEKANDKYNELEGEIDELENKKKSVGSNIDYFEARIAALKKEITDSFLNERLSRLPENEFQYCF